MSAKPENDSTCCPPFDPEPWDDKTHEWENKKFIRKSVFTFFYMPVNLNRVIKRLEKKVKMEGATIPDLLCLSDHTSNWNMNIYLAVDKEIPGCENTTLSGRFYSRVYEGAFKDTGKWCEDFEAFTKSKGLKTKKWYMWYTTCPKCAKKYGENHVVIFSSIE